MSPLYIRNNNTTNSTLVSNQFLDHYMPEANGEFVKIYLYLLRAMDGRFNDLSLASIADTFNCTENDVDRALRYWVKKQLLSCEEDERQQIVGITLLSLEQDTDTPAVTPVTTPAPKQTQTLTVARVKELKQNKDIVQLLFIAEKYLGKTLSPTETSRLLYFHEELHFSTELIEYLIEYCVSKGHKSIHYIETVALAWHKSGITTVEMAKQDSVAYTKNYFAVLKALGVSNRNPVDSEIKFIDRWSSDFGFTLEIIVAACNRTITQTGKPSFAYTDGILSSWHEKGVKHLPDIDVLDEQYRSEKERKPASKKSKTPNKFNNFPQRDYDYNDLEKQLLKQ